jgi:putative inorganic carbon (HCO3(-)) transporter
MGDAPLMRDMVVLFALLFTMPMIFRRPFVGVILWAWISFLGPEDYLYGFLVGVPLIKIIAAVTIPCVLLSRERKHFYVDGFTVTASLFAILGILSCIYSEMAVVDPWEICGRVLKVLVFCFMMQMLVRNQMRIHAILIAVCVGLGFHGVLEALKFLASAGNHRVIGPASIGDNNSLALAIDMMIPILIYLARHSVQHWAKIGFGGVAAMCAISVIATLSRGGFVGLVIVALGLSLTGRHKLRNIVYIAIMGAGLLAIAPSSWYERVDTIETANQDSSFMGRIIAWKMSTLIALDNPVLGAGFHGVQDLKIWQKYSPHFDSLNFIPTDDPTPAPHAAHSIYFEVLGDLGFTGLILFGSLLMICFLNISRIKRLVRARDDMGWAGNLADSLRISLFAYVVAGAALSMAYFELFFVLASLLSLLRRFAERDTAPAAVKAGVRPLGPHRPPQVGAPVRTGAA